MIALFQYSLSALFWVFTLRPRTKTHRQSLLSILLLCGLSIIPKQSPAQVITRLTDMPTARTNGCAVVMDGKIYTIGGHEPESVAHSVVEVYDPVSDSWDTSKTPMPTARYHHATALVSGRIYAFGGFKHGGFVDPYKTIEEYDPITNSWTQKADLPFARAGLSTAVLDGKIYLIGGTSTKHTYTIRNTVFEYEPDRSRLLQSATRDLQVRAGSIAELPVEMTLKDPLEDGTFPELQVDLSLLGEPRTIELAHQGDGRYTSRLEVTPAVNGEFYLPVRMVSPGVPPLYIYNLFLQVWPAGNLPILAEGLAPGWESTTSNVEDVALIQTDVAYTGSTAGAVQTKNSVTGWTVLLKPGQPIVPFGYESLHLVVHPGDMVPGEGDRLQLSLLGGQKPVDLREGSRVDWSRAEWQTVDIPLTDFGVEEPITGVQFSGTPVGTLYLDDVVLISGQASAFTAVLESRAGIRPEDFILQQNYPNPFNSRTVIRFNLPQRETVELAVFNLAGQQVATLVDGMRPVGAYTVHWDGRDDQDRQLASGVYLYRLQVGQQQMETRKLVLMK